MTTSIAQHKVREVETIPPIDLLKSSKAFTIDQHGMLCKEKYRNLHTTRTGRTLSKRSKYSNPCKLVRSSLFESVKKHKTSIIYFEQERNIQIQLLSQSLQILERDRRGIGMNFQKEMLRNRQQCQKMVRELLNYY